MRYLAFVPAAIALYLFIRSVAAKSVRRSPEWQKNRVYLPNLLFWVGLLTRIFLKESLMCRKDFVSCCRFSSSYKAYADCM